MKPAVLESSRSRYLVGEFLAEGGMGAIYLGRRAGAGEGGEVILKALLPEFVKEQHFVDLFLREARLTAGLDHPNIVRTLDLVTGEETYFIVMEYVCGADLRTATRRAKRRGRSLSPQAAIFGGLAILEALAYAHSRLTPDGAPLGLIHRDISPSNILLGGDGSVKLSDFGIAKLSTHRSVFYKVKGKVGYMSPEQARGETLDARSDLFSLAVCVHEGLTGERLFAALPMATAAEIYARPAPRPSERRPGLGHAIDAVMAKALDYDPAARFQSAIELRDALLRAAAVSGLLYRREDMAAHLCDVLGRDARAWLRGGLDDERAGLTVPWAPTPHLKRPEDLFEEADSGEILVDEDEDSDPAPPRAHRTQVTGTSVVSMLAGGLEAAAAQSPPEPPSDPGADEPRSPAVSAELSDEMTMEMGGGLGPLLAGRAAGWSEEVTAMVGGAAPARRERRGFDEPTAIAEPRRPNEAKARDDTVTLVRPAPTAPAPTMPAPIAPAAPALTAEVALPPARPATPAASSPSTSAITVPERRLPAPRDRRALLLGAIGGLAVGVLLGLLLGFLLFASRAR